MAIRISVPTIVITIEMPADLRPAREAMQRKHKEVSRKWDGKVARQQESQRVCCKLRTLSTVLLFTTSHASTAADGKVHEEREGCKEDANAQHDPNIHSQAAHVALFAVRVPTASKCNL